MFRHYIILWKITGSSCHGYTFCVAAEYLTTANMEAEEPCKRKPTKKPTYESTWFSKDRITGYGEVLNAHSEIASITS